jgi:hypothetical protein
MLKWFGRRVQRKGIARARGDIEEFISILKEQPDEMVGTFVALAAVMRITLEKGGSLPYGILESEVYERTGKAPKAAVHLRRLIARFQKGGQAHIAAPVMVWLHSLTTIFIPEITCLGQEMWVELRRGFPHAPHALDNLKILDIEIPDETRGQLEFVPPILTKSSEPPRPR